jgi:hypothetical protein
MSARGQGAPGVAAAAVDVGVQTPVRVPQRQPADRGQRGIAAAVAFALLAAGVVPLAVEFDRDLLLFVGEVEPVGPASDVDDPLSDGGPGSARGSGGRGARVLGRSGAVRPAR